MKSNAIRRMSTVVMGLALLWCIPAAAETTILVVRHAEKADPSATDPGLSPDGRERARVLRDMLRSVDLTAIYSTKYRRTIDTVTPCAESHKLNVEVRDPDMKSLAEEILVKQKDGTVLVAGHTNTVPALIKALGIDMEIDVADVEYDNLFIVSVDGDGRARLLRLHYGD